MNAIASAAPARRKQSERPLAGVAQGAKSSQQAIVHRSETLSDARTGRPNARGFLLSPEVCFVAVEVTTRYHDAPDSTRSLTSAPAKFTTVGDQSEERVSPKDPQQQRDGNA